MRNVVFLFVFIFSPVTNMIGSHGSTKTDKFLELLEKKEPIIPKTVEENILEAFSSWQTANASYYDSKDSLQTRENCNGIGAFGHYITSGSIALGSTFTETFRDKGMEVFIQIKNFNIMTPYGKGIFRVDDMMSSKFNRKGKFHIDFYHKDLSLKQKRMGRFKVNFRIYKITTVGE